MSGDLKSEDPIYTISPSYQLSKQNPMNFKRNYKESVSKSKEKIISSNGSCHLNSSMQNVYFSQTHTSINSPKERIRYSQKSRTTKTTTKPREDKKKTKNRKSKPRKEERKLNQSMNSPNFYNQVTQETCPGKFNFVEL
mmetsp:Transcript_22980/g.20418  ORF Transcript_22980/g.20418 Transcript_22980/m.20418 type:complete len:139 (-) Transcript_22980:58-474(-)